MKNYTFNVLLVRRNGGGYRAHCPGLPGCRAHGDTKDEAVQNIRISIMHQLQKLKAAGMPLPKDRDRAP